MEKDLANEAKEATNLLRNKSVDVVWRHNEAEVVVQFTDGTRLIIEQTQSGLELSIT